jgi:hypothetical protein
MATPSISVVNNAPYEENTIVLKQHQVEAYARLWNHILGATVTLLVAPTGSGKTVVTIKLFKQARFTTLFVVGPANIETKWVEEEAKKYGVNIIFISYTKLAGRAGKINHPYIDCIDEEFYASDTFKNIVTGRVMLVFDECQATKNSTAACSRACFALSREVRRQNNGSRIMALSATPFDKAELAESVVKLLGIVKQKELFFYNVGLNEYITKGYGFEELIEYCNRINPKLTEQLTPYPINAKAVRLAIFDMFIEVLKPRLVYSMPKPIIDAKFTAEARYCQLLDNEMVMFQAAMQEFNKSLRPDGGEIKINNGNIGALVKAFVKMEAAKVGIFERRAKIHLEKNPNGKVVIYVWHDDTVVYLMNALAAYSPLRCDGKVTKAKRAKHNTWFQQPNTKYRVIIAKATSFGIGIDLDDTHGSFPRVTLVNANYHFEKIHQAAGRTYRANTQSDVLCELIYAKDTQEGSIIDALRKKTDVTKAITWDDDEMTEMDDDTEMNSIIFPADYPIVVE